MFKSIPWLVTALLIATSPAARDAQAQPPRPATQPELSRAEQARLMLRINDADGDGFVTREEARPQFKALFDRIDVDRDGRLDVDELAKSNLNVRVRRESDADQNDAGQLADPDFDPPVPDPAFATGKGPLVLVDEAHYNFHTTDGRYAPLARLLRKDGYRVAANKQPFSRDALKDARILIVANALAEQNRAQWRLPTPSAFGRNEIEQLTAWIDEGGALILIADHMPFPGAAEELASALGVRWLNGFALSKADPDKPMRFDRGDDRSGRLADHPIARGRNEDERIGHVTTFTGSAFEPGEGFRPLLTFGADVTSLQPSVAWRFDGETPRQDVSGWCQGAVRQRGKGRIAVFGEAAMFSAQVSGPQRRPMGMNSPQAPDNARFLLNTVHWMSGLLDENGTR